MAPGRTPKKAKTGSTASVPVPAESVSTKAVILVGGASKGTRFRPLSLDCPKPLMMVAGRPMIEHHVEACSKLSSLSEIILLGFYEPELFSAFMESCADKYSVKIRYLREASALGTAGGLNRYKDDILAGNPSAVLILHSDIACTFPLEDMIEDHFAKQNKCTVLGKELSFDEAHRYGEMVVDSNTMELLHYAEKPQSDISPVINCGIYVFDQEIFGVIQTVAENRKGAGGYGRMEDDESDGFGSVRMEQDVLMPLAGRKKVFVFKTDGFWGQIKSPNEAIYCSGLYLDHFKLVHPELLATSMNATLRATLGRIPSTEKFDVGMSAGKLNIVGNCVIAASAKVSSSAKIGPNVSIADGVVVGAGARLQNCLVLEDVVIKEHAFIKNAILGWKSSVGCWTRVEGSKETPTIFGAGVTANNEVIIDECTVLPHKSISKSCFKEIIL